MKISPKASFLPSIKAACCLGAAAIISQPAFAADQTAEVASPNYSAGLTIGSMGLGVSLSGKTDWHLKNGDRIQWRTVVSGLDADFDDGDGVDIAGIEYDDGDFSLIATQVGVDWYPVQSGWVDEIFVSAGLLYADTSFKAYADNTKSYKVGSVQVNPGDLTSLETEIDNSEILPYISFGWGNKIERSPGFDFQAEIGLALSTSDANVTVKAVDPNNVLTNAAIKAEKKDIEKDIDGPMGFVTATVLYHF